MDTKTATVIAKNTESTQEQLESISGIDPSVDKLLAKHPKAGGALLEKLSHSSDKATRKNVVLNANTPKETLIRLAPQFPGDFFKNPAFDWLLLEDPNLLFSIGQGVLKNILKRPECPESFMNWAVEHGSEHEKLAVAMNPNAPDAALNYLVECGGKIGNAAKEHAKLASAEKATDLDALFIDEVAKEIGDLSPDQAKDLYGKKLLTAAQWPYLNEVARLGLLPIDPELLVDLAIANEEVQEKLMSNLEGRRILAACSNASAETYQELANEQDTEVLKRLSENKHAGQARLDARKKILLKRNPVQRLYDEIHGYVETDFLSPKEIHEILASNKNPKIFDWIFRHPNFPKASRLQLLQKLSQSKTVMLRQLAASNPECPAELLDALSTDKNVDVRYAVAGNPSCPRSALLRLADDRKVAIGGMMGCLPQYAVASNVNCPVDILLEFAGANESSLRSLVASNPNCNEAILKMLAEDKEHCVRYLVARHQLTTPDLLEQLAFDQSSFVREYVAQNANCSLQTIQKLANDTDPGVRYAVSINKGFPADARQAIFEELVLNSDWKIYDRKKIVLGSQLSTDLLQKLSRDNSVEIRSAVASRQDCPEPCLRTLATDKSSTVRQEVARNPHSPPDLLNSMSSEDALLSSLVRNPNFPEDQLQPLWMWLIRNDYGQINGVWNKTYGYKKDSVEVAQIPPMLLKQVSEECVDVLLSPSRGIAWQWLQDQQKDDSEKRACAAGNLLYVSDQKADAACNNNLLAVRLLGLSSTKTSPALLAKRSTSTAWIERLAVARNPNTPANLIEKLKKDPHQLVSKQAEITKGTKSSIAERQRDLIEQSENEVNWGRLNKELESRCKRLKYADVAIEESLNAYGGRNAYYFDSNSIFVLCIRYFGFHKILPEQLLRNSVLAVALSSYIAEKKKAGKLSNQEVENVEYISSILNGGSSRSESRKDLPPWENPEATSEELNEVYQEIDSGISARIKEHEQAYVLICLARHPATPEEILGKLASSQNTRIRVSVASNQSIPGTLIDVLSKDIDWMVRSALAHNSVLERRTCEKIMHSVDSDLKFKDWSQGMRHRRVIRYNDILKGSFVPTSLLTSWAKDESLHPIVRFACVCNPNYPEADRLRDAETLITLMGTWIDSRPDISTIRFSPEEYVMPLLWVDIYLGSEPHNHRERGVSPDPADKKSLEKAAKAKDWLKRAAAAICPESQPGLLRMLLEDEVEVVRQIAASRLKELDAEQVAT